MRKVAGVQSLQAPASPAGGARHEQEPEASATDATDALERLAGGAERAKKSVAYRHTEFHRSATDAAGKEFERRMCRYCDAIFSFKGGTTSAPLRHLKTAHPEQLLAEETPLAAATAVVEDEQVQQSELLLQPLQVLQQQQQLQQHQLQQQPPPLQIQQQIQLGQASAYTSDGNDGQTESGDSPSGIAALTDAATVPPPTIDSSISSDNSSPSFTTTPVLDEVANYYAQKERRLRSILKRKRESGSFDVDYCCSRPEPPPASSLTALAAIPTQFAQLPTQIAIRSAAVPQLTASQAAICHILQHYKDELPVSARLKLAKHLTKNVGEAEMYNVLDEATRAEYIREFASAM